MAVQNKIKAGIVGAAGYTGGELIRLLINHPFAEISFLQSQSQAGKNVTDTHTDLLGECDLRFQETAGDADVVFLCMGHGESKKWLDAGNASGDTTVIDLSQDFRLSQDFVYGLPELNRNSIRGHKRIANPGCFATAIQLALLPLAHAGSLENEIHINATTGSTGAGQGLALTSHFSWRSGNMSSYKVFEHQHLAEISQSLVKLQPGFDHALNFIPNRGSYARGIFATAYTETKAGIDAVKEMYRAYYQSHPFVHISDAPIDLKQVVNTNKCLLHLQKHGNKLIITSIIDNLLKGASGQAVQNMNIAFGLEETAALKLKPSAY